eukprot:scaffold11575_cov66-Attheya_sp.AAC.3
MLYQADSLDHSHTSSWSFDSVEGLLDRHSSFISHHWLKRSGWQIGCWIESQQLAGIHLLLVCSTLHWNNDDGCV